MSNDRLMLLIDGSNLAYRAFMKFEGLRSPGGIKTGLIYGFMRLLRAYVYRFNPGYLVVAFDTKKSKNSNFRKNLLGTYKEHRNNSKLSIDYDEFNRQIKSVRRILKYLNVPVIWDREGLGHESDDYIAYLATRHKGKVYIVSSDKDFCQLINKDIKVFNPFKEAIIQNANCRDIMGYTPEECVDYLCLVGDKSDDIPGYSGMGKKRTRKFLDEFGSIENFLKDSKAEFSNIDRDALEYLYNKNKVLIDLRVALEKYPINKIPVIYYKKRKVSLTNLRYIFKKYYFNSFLTKDFIEPFKRIKPWEIH